MNIQRYYTGYPKDLGPSRVIHFTSEREFVQLLHKGYPVVVAFTIRGNYTKHLDKVLEEAAAEFYPHVKFMRTKVVISFLPSLTNIRFELLLVLVAPSLKSNYSSIGEQCIHYYSSIGVECPKYPGFCITRQRKEYPFVEIFHSPEQAPSQGRVADPNITKYAVKVLPFNYDQSAYGFREFFKRHGVRSSDDAK
ncbi:hypothetical protein TEA_014620 [Camellia sinensis var. sinensis]|uniref:Uncharacterized protein n=1 Tax=Camellia sinensis var. sinensis TaxID=542762 RepID=A0A4S4E385_CAMSN|nr:hypothetical protein TEA_014620 [Camellia sinensis var. sinensis]